MNTYRCPRRIVHLKRRVEIPRKFMIDLTGQGNTLGELFSLNSQNVECTICLSEGVNISTRILTLGKKT